MLRKTLLMAICSKIVTWHSKMKITLNAEAFGSQIKARRQTLNMTQDDLAAVLGTIRQRVAELENGKASAKLALALQACMELGLVVEVREA